MIVVNQAVKCPADVLHTAFVRFKFDVKLSTPMFLIRTKHARWTFSKIVYFYARVAVMHEKADDD